MRLIIALFFAATIHAAAQGPEVPHKMQFADLTLTIRDDARKEIQQDVDAYTKYPKSFNIKVERAKTYFPIIEKIFAEENVPDDFKYLVIQESALIPDAVSVSNAVGFWQFKDFTAVEMGLRVDKHIDERMNIVSSSRAAARYLKKNNTFFNNWLYALQAYQMGAGGVMRSEKDTKGGVKSIDITSKTYWYVKKYLAHKIAYEAAIAGPGEMQVIPYLTKSSKTLNEIAKEVSVEVEDLKLYNKWARTGSIPDDKSYTVLVPVKGPATVKIGEGALADATVGLHETATKTTTAAKAEKTRINGITAIKANQNETPAKLAVRAGVDVAAFIKWNEISSSDQLQQGAYYFLGKKRTRSNTAYHKVTEGESLWSVSQKYGVQLKRLKKYNRLKNESDVRPGMTLWLAATRPKESRDAGAPNRVVEVDDQQTFAWEEGQAKDRVDVEAKIPPSEPLDPDKYAGGPRTGQEIDQKLNKTDTTRNVARPVTKDSVQNLPVQDKGTTQVDSSASAPQKIRVVVPKTEHIVKQGETLYGIARLYDMAVMDLVNYNNLDLKQGIKPGQVLKLVENQELALAVETSSSGDQEHIVKPTDTVYSIARKYGVTIKELMEWNNKKDFNLAVGEKLKISKK